MTNTLTFTCSICGEPSTAICAYCTKDACGNHICERCGRCSDCCECEVRLEEPVEPSRNGAHPVTAEESDVNVEDEAQPPEAEHATDETAAHPEPVATDSLEAPPGEPAPPQAPPADEPHE